MEQGVDFQTTVAPPIKPTMNLRTRGIPNLNILLALIVAFTFAAGSRVQAQINVYLKIDSIQGESTARNHENEILATGCSFKVDQVGVTAWAGPVGGASKSAATPIMLKKLVDKSSPQLFISSLLGTNLRTVSLTFTKPAGAGEVDFLKITLTNALVTSYSLSSEVGDQAGEILSLGYQTITYKYTPQLQNGSSGTPVSVGFDLIRNLRLP